MWFYMIVMLVLQPTFGSCLWELLGSQVALSSAYHPQLDGQTKHTYQTVE